MPERAAVTVTVSSEEETLTLAGRLAVLLRPGDVLCLHGDLGAGKTTFTRGLVRALGSPAPVSSPTFTLIHEYAGGRLPVVHADAYRLSGAAEAEDAGLGEYIERGDAVLVIEWPERIADLLPPDRIDVTLADRGGDSRAITLSAQGGRWTGEDLRALAVAEGASAC
jgi:tRNA threonylcarbamoyladenosine biosynthesis protein TsaE